MNRANITLIVTGPIEGFTANQIKLFNDVIANGGDVIISTWESSKNSIPKDFPSEVKLLSSLDWASPVGYLINGKIKYINFDKQVHLIKLALQEVKTDYTLRLRSDISIELDQILQKIHIMDAGLLITTDVSSVNPKLFGSSKLTLHPCDWVFAAQTAVLKKFISDCEFYVDLIKKNIKLNTPYEVEDRKYFSTGAAEQYFGASLAGIKSSEQFFEEVNDAWHLLSPVSNGFYVIESTKLKLYSMKQKLLFKYPFRIMETDNFKYQSVRNSLPFLIDFIVHKLRCYLKIN